MWLAVRRPGRERPRLFVIPMLERLRTPKGPRKALILAPTRELAIQIQATIDMLAVTCSCLLTTVVGGADMQAQGARDYGNARILSYTQALA